MKLRDILFWIFILAAIGVAVWMAVDSPAIETGLLIIVIFILPNTPKVLPRG